MVVLYKWDFFVKGTIERFLRNDLHPICLKGRRLRLLNKLQYTIVAQTDRQNGIHHVYMATVQFAQVITIIIVIK